MADSPQQVRQRLRSAYGRTSSQTQHPTGLSEAEAITEHADLVRRVARRYARVTSAVLELDDLISVGMMGLLQAHKSYDSAGGKPFRTFAEFRIRGAILDELRRVDPLSQPQRRKLRKMESASRRLSHRLGREPEEDELADAMELSLSELQDMRTALQQVTFVRSESSDLDDIRIDLRASQLDRGSLRVMLVDAIRHLPERDQQVLALYYLHDLRLREIGEIFEVTEARVCQIHKQAVVRLRAVLDEDGAFA